jgi:hypothetical protein
MLVRGDGDRGIENGPSRHSMRAVGIFAASAAMAAMLITAAPASAASFESVKTEIDCYTDIDPGPPGGGVRGPAMVWFTTDADTEISGAERGPVGDEFYWEDTYTFRFEATYKLSERYGRTWKRLAPKTVRAEEKLTGASLRLQRRYRGKASKGKTRLTAVKGTVVVKLIRSDGTTWVAPAKSFSARYRDDDKCDTPIFGASRG